VWELEGACGDHNVMVCVCVLCGDKRPGSRGRASGAHVRGTRFNNGIHTLYMQSLCIDGLQIGLARTIYIRCIYGIYGRDITKYTVYKRRP